MAAFDHESLELQCPITQTLLQDPVTCPSCRQSFSRDAIHQHLAHHRRLQAQGQRQREDLPKCPLCNGEVSESTLFRNRTLEPILERIKRAQRGQLPRLGGNRFQYDKPLVAWQLHFLLDIA